MCVSLLLEQVPARGTSEAKALEVEDLTKMPGYNKGACAPLSFHMAALASAFHPVSCAAGFVVVRGA
jgi:hypothetical protein